MAKKEREQLIVQTQADVDKWEKALNDNPKLPFTNRTYAEHYLGIFKRRLEILKSDDFDNATLDVKLGELKEEEQKLLKDIQAFSGAFN